MRGVFEPPPPVDRDEERWLHAAKGWVVACDRDELIICHACGEALAQLSSQHVARHGLTLTSYRERFGLNRQQPLMSPAMLEARREEGLRRIQLPAVADGLAQGQAMARSGELLALSHKAQQRGTARLQRRNHMSAALSQSRQDQRETAKRRRHERAVELGFQDVHAYLRARRAAGASTFSMARELRCGNARTIQRLLTELDDGARP